MLSIGSTMTTCRKTAAVLIAAFAAATASAQERSGDAWRVECNGDGKTLECSAVQQLVTREDRKVVAVIAARMDPATKAPVLAMQLPLGISVSDPVLLKINGNPDEKLSIQTCANNGCYASVPLKEALMNALRTGTTLKISFQNNSKQTLNIDVPLLGFGLAFDKATK